MGELKGRVFAGYELLHPIGQGGMGMVYRARQLSLGREVALKVIREGIKELSTVFRRFERETRIHMQVSHPNLVAVLDAGMAEGRPFLAMELVDGKGLGDLIADRGPLPVTEVIAIGAQLADALAYLHASNILHRDLKPANILIARGGDVKVVDFGLARFESETWLTTEQEWFGTVLYSAPEIFESREYAPPADVYSMGLILLEALTGKPVVRAKVVTEAIEEILFRPVLPPRFHGRDGVPEDLEQVVMSMVVKDPAARPTAADLVSRFQQLLEVPPGVPDGEALTTDEIVLPEEPRGTVEMSRSGGTATTEPDPPPTPGAGAVRRTGQGRAISGPGTAHGDPAEPAPAGPVEPARAAGPVAPDADPRSPRPTGEGRRRTGRRTGLVRSWLTLAASPVLVVLLVSMAGGFGLYTGLRLIFPGEAEVVTTVTPSGPPPASPSPSPSPAKAQIPALMRAKVIEIFALLHRYDQSCPDAAKDRKDMVIRASILAENFFRLRRGDISILFTTLSRLRDVIREGDEAAIDDPAWLDVDRVAYEVIEEAARSHGFDTGSPLQPVLLRLEGEIAAGSPVASRECLAISLLSQFSFFKEMSTEKLVGRNRFQRQLLERLEVFPQAWRESPRGVFTRFNILNRIADVHGSAFRLFRERSPEDLQGQLAAARRETFDFYRREMDHFADVDPDLELWARWMGFHSAATVTPHLGDDAAPWKEAVRILNRLAPRLEFAELPPTYRNQFLEDLANMMTEMERREESTIDPRFAEAHRKWNGSAPVDNSRLLH